MRGAPGCAVSVMRGGDILFAKGYGDANLEYDVPITPSSVFHVASVSKQFTALAVALLVADGRVSWDDDIRRYVPELPDLGEPITLRHLAHHTSGIRDQWSLLQMAGWRWEGDVITQGDVLDLLSRQTAVHFPPGSRYLYSNSGYTLLAVVVERVSGRTLREFTTTRLFEPLGMTQTTFRDDHTMIVRNRAYAYESGRTGGYRLSIPDFAVVGASSLFTTVRDLARWNRNFRTGEVDGRGVLRQLQERGALAGGARISYGFGLVHGRPRPAYIAKAGVTIFTPPLDLPTRTSRGCSATWGERVACAGSHRSSPRRRRTASAGGEDRPPPAGGMTGRRGFASRAAPDASPAALAGYSGARSTIPAADRGPRRRSAAGRGRRRPAAPAARGRTSDRGGKIPCRRHRRRGNVRTRRSTRRADAPSQRIAARHLHACRAGGSAAHRAPGRVRGVVLQRRPRRAVRVPGG